MADHPTNRRSSVLNTILLIVLVSPFLFNAVRWVGATWHPAQDFAALEVKVRSVLTLHSPSLGAFSRYGWSHPGPVWYWLLAPLYFVTGGQPWALVTGANLVEAGVLVVGWFYARRLNPRFGPLYFTAAALMPYWWTGTWLQQAPWNPHLAVPFILTTLVGALGGWDLDRWGLALIVASWSILLQLHFGFATSVTPIVIVVLARATWLMYRSGTLHALWSRPARWLLTAIGLMWVPPIVQELAHYPGNLSHLISFSLHGSAAAGPKAGLRYAVRTVSEGFRVPTSFTAGINLTFALDKWLIPHGAITTGIAVLVVCAAGVILLPASPQRRLSAVAIAYVATATISVSQISGERWGYLFDFAFVASSVAWIAAVGTLVALVRRWFPRLRVPLVTAVEAAVVLLVVALASGQIVGLQRRGHRVAADEVDGWILASQALKQVPARGVVVSVDFGGQNDLGLNDALLNEADRHHKNVRADVGDPKFSAQMRASQASASQVWEVSEDSFATTLLLSFPGARQVSFMTPLSQDEELLLREAQLRVAAILVAANKTDLLGALGSGLAPIILGSVPGVSRDDIDVISSMSTKIAASGHCRCAVVAFGAGTQPSSPNSALHTLLPSIGTP